MFFPFLSWFWLMNSLARCACSIDPGPQMIASYPALAYCPASVSYATEAGQYANAGYEAIICGPGSIEQASRATDFFSTNQLRIESIISFPFLSSYWLVISLS